MRTETERILFSIDREKALRKERELGIPVVPCRPVIKNTGLYADAGIDLFAAYPFEVQPGEFLVVDSFVILLLPVGTVGLIWPRGGDTFLVGSGVIDPGYTGTIKVRLVNPYKNVLCWDYGDSLGQVVLLKKAVHAFPVLEEVERGDVVSRGDEIVSERKRGEDGRINEVPGAGL